MPCHVALAHTQTSAVQGQGGTNFPWSKKSSNTKLRMMVRKTSPQVCFINDCCVGAFWLEKDEFFTFFCNFDLCAKDMNHYADEVD